MVIKVREKHTAFYRLTRYVVISYIKVLLIALAATLLLFEILYFSGLYTQIETALNLKYNSPFIVIPLYGSVALALLCLFVGFLLYFHKYKRPKSGGTFYKTFSAILDKEQAKRTDDVTAARRSK